jgi:peroxiredoxin
MSAPENAIKPSDNSPSYQFSMKPSQYLKTIVPVAYFLLAALSHAAQTLPDAPEKVAPLTVGSKAPTLVLPAADGPFDLGKAIAQKPTILVFYRANWCGLGRDALAELQREAPFFGAVGFQIIAVSTDTPESLKPAAESNQLGFPLLSDRSLSLASAYGIAFRASKKLVNDYSKKGISLASIPGEENASGLLVPSVFIVDNTGVIRWVYSNPKRNPTPSELIAATAKAHRHIVSQSIPTATLAAQL